MCTHSIDDLLPHAPLHYAATGEMVKGSYMYKYVYICMHTNGGARTCYYTSDFQPPNFTDFSADYLLVEYQCSSIRR